MRVTSSAFYNNIYGENNKINRQLFDVNKQISSGMKIQYSHENPGVFIDTLRLDDEVTTLTQIKSSVQNAYKTSTQTDTTVGEIVSTLEKMKVKLINAANDYHSNTSMQAIGKELRGLKNHLLTLSNTSIGGLYLFSGTAISVKPIAADGTYQGNDKDLQAFLGSGIKQKYNISGSQLFLGEETSVSKTLTSNLAQMSLSDLYPDIMKEAEMDRSMSEEHYITPQHTIRDLMGDLDDDPTNDGGQAAYFYLQGSNSSGDSFKKKISIGMDKRVEDLLREISDAYGAGQVNVSLNSHGQIEISDKKTGSSKLDFHMVGAIDFSGGGNADVPDIDLLQPANNADTSTTDFSEVIAPGSSKLLYVKEFNRSGYTPTDSTDTIEGVGYDRVKFTQDGARLLSGISQIINGTNEYATPATRLSEVSGTPLDGKQLILEGNDITGAAFSAQIDFTSGGSTFTLNGTPYTIYTATAPRIAVPAEEMTYQQLLDVVNIAMSGTVPAGDSELTYDEAIFNANLKSTANLDYAGRVVFEDKTAAATLAEISMYDAFSATYPTITPPDQFAVSDGAALKFHTNNALTVRDPKTDFFAQIDEIIRSVEEGKVRSNGYDTKDPRNIGIHNAITRIDDISNHVTRLQTEAGSYSQVLQATSDRTDLLIVSTRRLQSDVIDTDIAEATMRIQQLSLNYQALLSNVSRVSKLSLVNYL